MRRALAIVIGLAALCGCSTLDPYETIPLKQTPDTRPHVGLCFDKFRSTPEKLLAAAQESCGKGMSAVPDGTDYGIETLDVCPVLLPGRATFSCVPQK